MWFGVERFRVNGGGVPRGVRRCFRLLLLGRGGRQARGGGGRCLDHVPLLHPGQRLCGASGLRVIIKKKKRPGTGGVLSIEVGGGSLNLFRVGSAVLHNSKTSSSVSHSRWVASDLRQEAGLRDGGGETVENPPGSRFRVWYLGFGV